MKDEGCNQVSLLILHLSSFILLERATDGL
jgi:hypothetical protein